MAMCRSVVALWLVTVVPCLVTCHEATQLSLSSQQRSNRALLSESDHKYEVHDQIKLYANKVGPFSNPRSAKLIVSLNIAGSNMSALVVLLQPYCDLVQ